MSKMTMKFILLAVAVFLMGQAAPECLVTPEQIQPQGEGSTLDADMVDGKHASEFVTEETDPTVPASVKDGVDFNEVSGTATDAQIPNDITVDHAMTAGSADTATFSDTAGDADTVGGMPASELGSRSLWLIDADGTEVGLILRWAASYSGEFIIFTEAFDVPYGVETEIKPNRNTVSHYEANLRMKHLSTDCSGTAYMANNQVPQMIFYNGARNKYYYFSTGLPGSIQYFSEYYNGTCTEMTGTLENAGAYEEYNGPFPTFTLPYHAELR